MCEIHKRLAALRLGMEAGLGAIIGFVLAQLVSFAKLAYKRAVRARLSIEPIGDGHRILFRSMPVGGAGEWAEEVHYGFQVRNTGRRVASHVRFQLIKVEARTRITAGFGVISDTAFDLLTYSGADRARGSEQVTIVPSASALVALASWREDFDVIMPATISVPDYYQEACADASEYRFTVVAFDEADFAERAFILRPGASASTSQRKADAWRSGAS